MASSLGHDRAPGKGLWMAAPDAPSQYMSRGGEKLAFALRAFDLSPRGLVACDLGSQIGGFVDCLLRHGARQVYAVDTAYGVLAWELRNDPRVVVMERTNALHVVLPERVDLVTIDVGWTRQALILPHALELLAQGGHVISLLKPQYEAVAKERRKGVVRSECWQEVVRRTFAELERLSLPLRALAPLPSPTPGGNREVFLLLGP
jgi:23S rRNA (cytidine1920-2'-O)/16S rRNA (cytidine1409-2'-O)-methyltransferase